MSILQEEGGILVKPFFYEIKYYMEDFNFYHGKPDPTCLSIAIQWIDPEYNPNAQGNVFPNEHRGCVSRLSIHRPTIHTLKGEINIPFPTKEWKQCRDIDKPSEIVINGHTYKLVDRWNGYVYRCDTIVTPEELANAVNFWNTKKRK